MDGPRLERWLADAVAAEAAADRSRQRTMRRAAEEEATVAGLLVELAERDDAVSLSTISGRVHHGNVVAVGRDVGVLRDRDRRITLVPLAAVATFASAGLARRDATGARPGPAGVSLRTLLAELAADRPTLRLATLGAAGWVDGWLHSVGVDVAVLGGGVPPASRRVVALGAVTEVVLLES